jgi:hypothetical protein
VTDDRHRSWQHASPMLTAHACQAGTALIVSSAAGKLPSIGALVRHGANVNYETRSGLTALVVAAAKGQSKVRRSCFRRGFERYKLPCYPEMRPTPNVQHQ